jgi:hypothetical protein
VSIRRLVSVQNVERAVDDIAFCDNLWDVVESYLTAKERVVVANSLADLLDDYGMAGYADTDWYNEYGTKHPEEDEEE